MCGHLASLSLDLACGNRILESPTVRDEHYQKFSEHPSALLSSEYPLNDHTRHFFLGTFSPVRYSISLKMLCEEIYSGR